MSKKMSNFAPDFERQKSCPGGGMVDAVDSKSAVSNGVRVQVPPGVQCLKISNLREFGTKKCDKFAQTLFFREKKQSTRLFFSIFGVPRRCEKEKKCLTQHSTRN